MEAASLPFRFRVKLENQGELSREQLSLRSEKLGRIGADVWGGDRYGITGWLMVILDICGG